MKKKTKVCDCCKDESKPVEKTLILSDGQGIILDIVNFCADDWHEREITIHDKSLDY